MSVKRPKGPTAIAKFPATVMVIGHVAISAEIGQPFKLAGMVYCTSSVSCHDAPAWL